MSAITSKAIVITAYPGKHGSITMPSRNAQLSLLDTVDIDSDDSSSGGGPKKRRRLTHLSPDEKLLRRKLKNRVAAQTARDRKKALMAELEEKVANLEEENKLLKKQNFSLKETSSTLAKENAALKSRLSEQPQAITKTDSDTLSTYCSSAEGAGSDSVSVDGSILHLCDNAQPDDFLGLLQEFAENKCEHPQAQATTSIPQSVCGGSNPGSRPGANKRVTTPGMVGLTPAELESLNELISIDHIYVKPQPLNLEEGKEGQQKSTLTVPKEEHNDSSNVSPPHYKCLTSPGDKRSHIGQLIQPLPLTHSISASLKHELDYIKSAPDFTISQLPLPSTPFSSSQLDESVATDDFINSFSDSDMERSLNLFQGFDLDMMESHIATDCAKQKTSEIMSVPEVTHTFDPIGGTALADSELNATKLFDEIYEHYLSIKKSNSPNPSVISDSGVSSDVDAMSPLSSDESLHDDVLWQDTSFADLFPDLQ